MRTVVVLSALISAIFISALPGAAQDVTEAECRKKFLELPNKDWRGYDEFRRAATQLRAKNSESQALPVPSDGAGGGAGTPVTPPASGGNEGGTQ